MLKITKVVGQTIANMSGCGKQSDYSCGIRAKFGWFKSTNRKAVGHRVVRRYFLKKEKNDKRREFGKNI